MRADELRYELLDELEREAAAVVDTGLGDSNDHAAPLDQVRPLACFARARDGMVVGGAVGRTWGECCELQQIWVEPSQRRAGIASRLIGLFEGRAFERGCRMFYLETFSFQAPALYRRLGYQPANAITGFPDGIVKYLMTKRLPATQDGAR